MVQRTSTAPSTGASTIRRAISCSEVSSQHDPAGHYPGSECLTPPLPSWPTVARENYLLPDTTLMPPLSSVSPQHGWRGGEVTRAHGEERVRSDEFRGRAGVSPGSSRCMIVFCFCVHLLSPRSQTSGSEEIRKIITFRFRLSVLFAARRHSRQYPPLFFFSMNAVRTRTIPILLCLFTPLVFIIIIIGYLKVLRTFEIHCS